MLFRSTRFEQEAMRAGKEAFFPSRALSTDNAAMIAAAGYASYAAGMHADSTLNADPNLPLAARLYNAP